jgi:hypothetical protein
LHPASDIEIVEITKIAENAHRYLQITFAEDLYLYCKTNNLSFPELRDAINTKWNVNILKPRDGIGGFVPFSDSTTIYHLSIFGFQVAASLIPVVVLNASVFLCSNTINYYNYYYS